MPGGGAALLHLSELVPAFRETLALEEEKLVGDAHWKRGNMDTNDKPFKCDD